MEQSRIHNEPLSVNSRDILGEILRLGAQAMLAEAIEKEVAEYINSHGHNYGSHAHFEEDFENMADASAIASHNGNSRAPPNRP